MSFAPNAIDEASQLVAALPDNARLRIVGGGTKAPAANGQVLCTSGLNRIIELSPGDLTCTVEAGMSLRDLDAVLAPHGLCLPLDPPDHDGCATVGGMLAYNDSGPLRAAYGTAREHVIGMSMILAGGTLIKSGGRVVKNVAGYDLHRAIVGSHGSLGLIVSASFKLRPRAECRRLMTLRPASVYEAEIWTAALWSGPTRPSILDWLRDGPSAPRLVVGYEDCREAVEWQVSRTLDMFQPAEAHEDAASIALYEKLHQRAMIGPSRRFRAAIPPARVCDFFHAAPITMSLQAYAAGAMIHGSAMDLSDREWSGLRRAVIEWGGWIDWSDPSGRRCWERGHDAVVASLESRLKRQLDPSNVFAPAPFEQNL